MGISLTGLTPATTYDALIKVGDNGPIDATLKVLSDGLGTNLPMEASTTGVNFTGTLQQSGVAVPTAGQVAAKQDTLVSGTNIKTINSTSILGSGNIAVVTSPSGVAGAIQFSNGSAFASDAANLFWDDTNNRLGVGTNSPSTPISIISGNGSVDATTGISFGASPTNFRVANYFNIGILTAPSGPIYSISSNGFQVGKTYSDASGVNAGMLGVRGSGSTSATTSLLVQNSSAATSLQIKDDGTMHIVGKLGNGNDQNLRSSNNNISFGAGYYYRLYATADADSVILGSNYDGSNTFTYAERRFVVGASSMQATAVLQADSTTRGFLPPRMTTTQKNAIASPATGLVLYDSTTNKLQCYNGSTWNDLF